MNAADADPSPDELDAMAYSDGELAGAKRAAFEARLALEPLLAQRVAQYHALDLVAREMAPKEPADYEWERLELDPLYRAGTRLGNSLVVAGGGGCLLALAWSLFAPVPRALLVPSAALLAGGVGLLFLTTLQSRLRTLPYDPYRKVRR